MDPEDDSAFVDGKGNSLGGIVFEGNIDGDHPEMTLISDRVFDHSHAPRRYLVEWSGMLLQVLRRIRYSDETDDYKTFEFEIYEFNNGKWIKLNDLGRGSLFVGVNAAVALLHSELFTFKPNCIYFTDHFRLPVDNVENGGDMGAFNLADGTIKPYRGFSISFFSPPMWIVPTSSY